MRSARTLREAPRRRCRRKRPRRHFSPCSGRRRRRNGARQARRMVAAPSRSSPVARAQRPDGRRGRRRHRAPHSRRLVRGSDRCRSEGSPRRSLLNCSRKVVSACASPSVPGCGRGPRRTARSNAATARRSRASRGAGMLEQGEQVDRRKRAERGLRGKPCERPGRGVGERIAAGIVDRNGPARQCGEHAARERAVGGDQRCGLVRRLQRFAQCDRDGERFFLGICSFDDRQCRERRGRRNIGAGELPP